MRRGLYARQGNSLHNPFASEHEVERQQKADLNLRADSQFKFLNRGMNAMIKTETVSGNRILQIGCRTSRYVYLSGGLSNALEALICVGFAGY